MADQETLNQEAEVFETYLAEWRQAHLGQFVLIKEREVIGFFGTLDEAFAAGTQRFGLRPFFVKQIVPGDAVGVSLFGQRLLSA